MKAELAEILSKWSATLFERADYYRESCALFDAAARGDLLRVATAFEEAAQALVEATKNEPTNRARSRLLI